MTSKTITTLYGDRVRLRVCGVLKYNDKVLLVNHSHLNIENQFWNFPGGGVEQGETIEDALIREFREETEIQIKIGNLLHLNEYIAGKLHAVELYFNVNASNLAAKLGQDPEFNIIKGVSWFNKEELSKIPTSHKPSFLSTLAFPNG